MASDSGNTKPSTNRGGRSCVAGGPGGQSCKNTKFMEGVYTLFLIKIRIWEAMWRLREKIKENKLAADISNDDAEHEEEDYYDEACMDDTEDINMEDMDYHELETSALSTDDENDEDVDDTDDDKEFDESKNNIVW
eukprot:gene11102-19966_t